MDLVLDELRELADGDEEAFGALLGAYLTASETLTGEIAAAIEGADPAAARLSAHALKGSAGQFGVLAVMRAAHAVEMAAAKGDLAQTAAHFEALREAHERASNQLRAAKLVE